jgi:hypothetical protein
MSAGRRRPEAMIQRALIEHLAWRAAPDAFVFAVPNGGYRRPVEAAILRSTGTVAGVPDVIIIHRGRVFAVELKTETGGRVTEVQRTVHDRMRRAGAEVAACFGLDAALAAIDGWGLFSKGGASVANGED